jgi:hypothetical protein
MVDYLKFVFKKSRTLKIHRFYKARCVGMKRKKKINMGIETLTVLLRSGSAIKSVKCRRSQWM